MVSSSSSKKRWAKRNASWNLHLCSNRLNQEDHRLRGLRPSAAVELMFFTLDLWPFRSFQMFCKSWLYHDDFSLIGYQWNEISHIRMVFIWFHAEFDQNHESNPPDKATSKSFYNKTTSNIYDWTCQSSFEVKSEAGLSVQDCTRKQQALESNQLWFDEAVTKMC